MFFKKFLFCLLYLASGTRSKDSPSNLVLEAPESLEFLKKYGYLNTVSVSGSAPESLYSRKSVETALKEAQKFGGIPQTGELDGATIKLFKSKRCGVADVVKNGTNASSGRQKRFILASEGWDKRHISYFLSNWSPRLTRYEVMEEMRKAFDTWGKYSKLVFTETLNPSDADIKIGFYRGHHGDNNPFDGEGNVLAHAFFPSDGLGGDIHFDDDEKWAINPGHFEDRVDFSAVALHELGHSLGLSHSPEEGSIMNPYYKGKTELGVDDILAMHKLYIQRKLSDDIPKKPEYPEKHPHYPHYPHYPHHPEHPHFPHYPDYPDPDHPHYPDDPEFPYFPYWPHEHPYHPKRPWSPYSTAKPPTTSRPTKKFTFKPTQKSTIEVTFDQDDESVEKHKDHDDKHGILPKDEPRTDSPEFVGCTGGFDTVTYFRGELFVIKNQLLWRLSEPGKVESGYPVDMHRLFNKLPPSVKTIDAIYQRTDDSSIIIFSGKQYWIFDGFSFIENSPRPITDYGLPESEDKVDAVMVGIDQKVYVFRGDKFWRFNETEKTFESKKPHPISTFRGVPDNLDAALTYKKETYFIKGNEFWVYNDEKDYAEKKYGGTASNYWLSC